MDLDQNTGITFFHLLFGAFWVASIGIAIWWTRKAGKHPDYAARFEAERIDPLLRRLGLDSAADYNLTAAGGTVYQQATAKAADLEATARKLLEEAKALRDRSGNPPPPQ